MEREAPPASSRCDARRSGPPTGPSEGRSSRLLHRRSPRRSEAARAGQEDHVILVRMASGVVTNLGRIRTSDCWGGRIGAAMVADCRRATVTFARAGESIAGGAGTMEWPRLPKFAPRSATEVGRLEPRTPGVVDVEPVSSSDDPWTTSQGVLEASVEPATRIFSPARLVPPSGRVAETHRRVDPGVIGPGVEWPGRRARVASRQGREVGPARGRVTSSSLHSW